MNIQELIEALQPFDPATPVAIDIGGFLHDLDYIEEDKYRNGPGVNLHCGDLLSGQ